MSIKRLRVLCLFITLTILISSMSIMTCASESTSITLEVEDRSSTVVVTSADGKSWVQIKPGGRDGSGKNYICKDDVSANTDAMKYGYMQGYPGGYFMPDKTLTRAEFAVIMYRAFKFKNVTTIKIFSDVQGHWAQTEINALTSYGILEGVNSTQFLPNSEVTRGQVLIILDRILNLYDYSSTFVGEKVNSYYNSDAIARVLNSGLYTDSVGADYDPSQPISRAEMIHLVNNVLYARDSTNANNEEILNKYDVFLDIRDSNSRYRNDCIRAMNNNVLKMVVQ